MQQDVKLPTSNTFPHLVFLINENEISYKPKPHLKCPNFYKEEYFWFHDKENKLLLRPRVLKAEAYEATRQQAQV